MNVLLVSDTSVLIDLHRAGVLDSVFALPFRFAVPDVLYERELKHWDGPPLGPKGLQVLVLQTCRNGSMRTRRKPRPEQ